MDDLTNCANLLLMLLGSSVIISLGATIMAVSVEGCESFAAIQSVLPSLTVTSFSLNVLSLGLVLVMMARLAQMNRQHSVV